MRIIEKTIILFVAAFIVFAGGGGAAVAFMMRDTLSQEVGLRQLSLSKDLMREFAHFLYEREQNIRTIGQAPLIINELMTGEAASRKIEERRIRQFFDSTGPWDRLMVVDAEGVLRSSTSGMTEEPLMDVPYISEAFRGAMKGELYRSDVVPSAVLERPTMVFAYPVKNEGAVGSPVIGAVIAELSWPAITEYLEQYLPPLSLYLFNRDGLLIGTNVDALKEEVFETEHRYGGVLQSAANAKTGYAVQPGVEGRGDVLATFAVEEGWYGDEGNGWVLVFETPATVAFAAVQSRILAFILVFSGIMLVVFVALYFVIRRLFIAPLLVVASAMRKRTEGDRDIRIAHISTDEIGQVGAAFNRMADALNDLYRNLEQKVRARTRSLAEKNDALEAARTELAKLVDEVRAQRDAVTKEKSIDEAILNGIGDGVFALDSERRITLFNPVAERISGFSAKEAIGRPYADVLRFTIEKTGAINDTFVNDALTKGLIAQMANHTVLARKDGSAVPVADSAAPIKMKDGKILGCVVVFRDVTKEREVDQMKSEFVSVASHQLRTPLTGIKWFTELLLKRKLSKEIREYVGQIATSNERMVRLVDDLLNVSRIETGKKFDVVKKEADIVPIFKSVIAEQAAIAAQKRIALVCAKDAPRRLVLMIDELKMRQVMQNLINNAIKYSKEGTEIRVGCRLGMEEAEFFVRDQGIGIPAQQQHQVFKKFFRAENVFTMHTDGTGLGLYICQAIMEAHGGKIWFESEENKGTTFYFSLPIHPKNGAK